MSRIGFDNTKYLAIQSEHIRNRINQFGGKLYLEFGGKLFDDHHASRVLPGFEPDSKMRMLQQLRDDVEIVVAINAEDIIKNKVRSDLGITYDADVLRLIDEFHRFGFYVGSVVLTRYADHPSVRAFEKRLLRGKIPCYHHYTIPGYPLDVGRIVSEDGFGINDYIETTHSLVVLTAPGPGSGKMATCLSQLYHDHKRGIRAGYAKFETFPVWNLDLTDPVNLAYEAATADLNDKNVEDYYHKTAYGTKAVSYNRDLDIFPVLRAILEQINGGECLYKSPTDMGVNMIRSCIHDLDACHEASRKEILRRYYAARVEHIRGKDVEASLNKLSDVMQRAGVTQDVMPIVAVAMEKAQQKPKGPAGAMVLPDGRIVTGRTSENLGAASAMLLNALKALAGIDDSKLLIAAEVLEPITKLKTKYMGHRNPRLHTDEVLLALTISAQNDPVGMQAMEQLKNLRGSEAHFTVIISDEDERLLNRLGIRVSYEPTYETSRLYHK